MSVDPDAIEIMRQWVRRADGDLKTATHTLKLGRSCPTEAVAFHAQQCVEKYLKVALVFYRVDPPRVHDIGTLAGLLPSGALPAWPVREQRILTAYAVTARYPGDFEPITLREARDAVRMAKWVRGHIRRLLPKAALA